LCFGESRLDNYWDRREIFSVVSCVGSYTLWQVLVCAAALQRFGNVYECEGLAFYLSPIKMWFVNNVCGALIRLMSNFNEGSTLELAL